MSTRMSSGAIIAQDRELSEQTFPENPAGSEENPGQEFRSLPDGTLPILQLMFATDCVGPFVFSAARPSPQAQRRDVASALAKQDYSRRMTSRVETEGDVWVYWRCQDMDDVSRVCDLSVGGLFVSTPVPPPLGAKAKLDFLVQEGQIRAEAVVRHLVPGGGLGLRFTAITDKDCPRLVALLNRIRTVSFTPKVPSFTGQSR